MDMKLPGLVISSAGLALICVDPVKPEMIVFKYSNFDAGENPNITGCKTSNEDRGR